jgi:peroxiredoxin
MKIFHRNFPRWYVLVGFFALMVTDSLFARSGTNSVAAMDNDYVKTNGQYVTIGNIMVETNSPLNTEEFKQYHWRVDQLHKIMNSGATNSTDRLVEGAWTLARDYPNRINGYQLLMAATVGYEYDGNPAKGRALAAELMTSTAPEDIKLWAKGYLNRLDSAGKPVDLKFTAVDGQEVDLAQLRGKVVLVDFWATTCGPCVAELPRVKAAYDLFHAQGFEVIGISCDTDKTDLEKFVKQHGIPWPQYFDGKQQTDNKFGAAFGVDGIPHMFLVDKKGILRFDNVRAVNLVHPKGDAITFEAKIYNLLAED